MFDNQILLAIAIAIAVAVLVYALVQRLGHASRPPNDAPSDGKRRQPRTLPQRRW
jgi:hypothetical protein